MFWSRVREFRPHCPRYKRGSLLDEPGIGYLRRFLPHGTTKIGVPDPAVVEVHLNTQVVISGLFAGQERRHIT